MERASVLVGSVALLPPAVPSGLPALPASDRAAMALAMLRLGGATRAYCWRGDEEARRYALAAGAAGVLAIDDVRGLDFDLLLVGAGGAGAGGDLLLGRLAEEKQCAMVLDVLDVQAGGGALLVTRDLGRGARELLSVQGPAVLGISGQAPRLHYVSRYRRLAVPAAAAGATVASPAPQAAARPDAASRDPLAPLSEPWEPARPRARIEGLAQRTAGTATERMNALLGVSSGPAGRMEPGEAGTARTGLEHVVVADAETCARHLLRFLSHHGVIERRLTAGTHAAAPPPGGGRADEPGQAGAAGGPRRPAATPPPPALTGKLSRGPRPPGEQQPARIRGPYGKAPHA